MRYKIILIIISAALIIYINGRDVLEPWPTEPEWYEAGPLNESDHEIIAPLVD